MERDPRVDIMDSKNAKSSVHTMHTNGATAPICQAGLDTLVDTDTKPDTYHHTHNMVKKIVTR